MADVFVSFLQIENVRFISIKLCYSQTLKIPINDSILFNLYFHIYSVTGSAAADPNHETIINI